MKTQKIDIVYFSATYTTRNVVRLVAEQMKGTRREYDITQSAPARDVVMASNDVLVVGMPVYAGRIPATAALGLQRFKGEGTPAVIVCVYGNRDYDDALLEMKDVVERNGFRVVSAGAFIAQHSIFPAVGADRPDRQDTVLIAEFGKKSMEIIGSATDIDTLPQIVPKGNRPYKVPGKLPLRPRGDRKCTKCGICVKLCPARAIPAASPRRTDGEKCIACGRCIVVCPVGARRFGGFIYKMAGKRFAQAHSARREPDLYI